MATLKSSSWDTDRVEMISFSEFAKRCEGGRRFVRDVECEKFLAVVKDSMTGKGVILKMGDASFARARIGSEEGSLGFCDEGGPVMGNCPYGAEGMKPLPRAREGRLNPKGKAFLYLASEWETAIAEVRPCVGQLVSIANFEATQDLRVLDCADGHDSSAIAMIYEEVREGVTVKSVWKEIAKSFARPVMDTNNETDTSYVPTQVIAELAQSLGFDGIQFKSSQAAGYCLALFETCMADAKRVVLVRVKGLAYNHEVDPIAPAWGEKEA